MRCNLQYIYEYITYLQSELNDCISTEWNTHTQMPTEIRINRMQKTKQKQKQKKKDGEQNRKREKCNSNLFTFYSMP